VDFRGETVAALASKVRDRKVAARELVQAALDRIDAVNPTINAFVAVDGERALIEAGRLDERIAGGEEPGPLAGIPFGVKDLEDAAGFVTTHGSAALDPGAPAAHDSILVTRLRAAGAIVVGKTNTPELGWKGETDNARFGATRNPWQLEHSPGGSSGGSAAAIAAGMVPLATGSDGGGSIRIPSACCALSGLKPSLGRVPSGGSEPPSWHDLSTRGPMARRIADVALALDAVIGPDPSDLRSLPIPEAAWTSAVDRPHVPVRVAWSPTLGYAPVDSEVRAICERAVSTLGSLGAEVVEVESVFAEDPLPHWLALAASYNLRALESVRGTEAWARVDPLLAASMEWAEKLSALDVVHAADECHRLNLRLVKLFHDVRLLVTPTTSAPPPRCGEPGMIDGTPELNWARFTYPFNLTRSPAASVCAGFTAAGLPVGMQLVGPQHGDLVVLRAAAALEAALGFGERVAPL
jgi:aspartyl-tRNA(Asn)/glutamyl-tRNA(Gln) amidotransferase subunit A